MAYDTDNLKNKRGGATLETSDKPPTPAGVYEIPELGEKSRIITLNDPLFGDTQSEGIVRLGYVRVRDAKSDEIKTIVEGSRTAAVGPQDLKGLQARLSVLEGVHEQNIALQEDLNDARKRLADNEGQVTGVDKQSADTAKENAADVTAARTDTDTSFDAESGELSTENPNTDEQGESLTAPNDAPVSGSPATGDQGDGTPNQPDQPEDTATDKSLSQQNKTELLETASAEGVEGVTQDNTKEEIVTAIETKRAQSDAAAEDNSGDNASEGEA